MKILVACEESQAVANRLRDRGHEAFSCDILPCSGGHPEYHLQQDVLPLLHEEWDMIIAFPPCTHLAVSGARHFAAKRADGRQKEAIEFFLAFTNAPCPRIAIENPVGIMSTIYRKPDQIIQPYHFGHAESKKTCLWLKNLPLLHPTDEVAPVYVMSGGKRFSPTFARTGKGCSVIRSKTYPGIAEAMAEQWTK